MISDPHGRSAGRATLLVRAADGILGTHRPRAVPVLARYHQPLLASARYAGDQLGTGEHAPGRGTGRPDDGATRPFGTSSVLVLVAEPRKDGDGHPARPAPGHRPCPVPGAVVLLIVMGWVTGRGWSHGRVPAGHRPAAPGSTITRRYHDASWELEVVLPQARHLGPWPVTVHNEGALDADDGDLGIEERVPSQAERRRASLATPAVGSTAPHP
ncbi:MAG TPA: hypothetical protein VHO07_22640 [Streptosporangiaceae bacterium]|nr:hypothetical protein [Streptosporangiaceae bacterium]HEX2822934.1 hypothetical protein [Streptosporangiaceae bacterium]